MKSLRLSAALQPTAARYRSFRPGFYPRVKITLATKTLRLHSGLQQ